MSAAMPQAVSDSVVNRKAVLEAGRDSENAGQITYSLALYEVEDVTYDSEE